MIKKAWDVLCSDKLLGVLLGIASLDFFLGARAAYDGQEMFRAVMWAFSGVYVQIKFWCEWRHKV